MAGEWQASGGLCAAVWHVKRLSGLRSSRRPSLVAAGTSLHNTPKYSTFALLPAHSTPPHHRAAYEPHHRRASSRLTRVNKQTTTTTATTTCTCFNRYVTRPRLPPASH